MQKVIYENQINEYSNKIDSKIFDYSKEEKTEVVESYENFSVISFWFYDINNIFKKPQKMIIYIDREDLFYICDTKESYDVAVKYFQSSDNNEHALYLFFDNLLKGSTSYLESVEDRISKIDANIISEISKNTKNKIMGLRYEILRLKKYYEQFDFIFEELGVNDNGLLTGQNLKYFKILKNRSYRLLSMIIDLKEYIIQVRESYQAQIDIEQNKLMKFFTIITSIFSPLTLVAGWYGMNFKIPLFSWKYGYLFVIILSVIICTSWYIIFNKKKWF